MQIGVTYESIEQLQTDCRTTAANLTDRVSQLNSTLAPLHDSWLGTAYTAYQADQTAWTSAANDLASVLGQIAVALATAQENYTSAETTNTSNFAG